jgi:hypothetical protein
MKREKERERELGLCALCGLCLYMQLVWLLCFIRSCKAAIVLVLAKARKNPIDSALFIRDHRNPSWIIIQYTSIYYVSISVEDMRSYDDNFVFM